MDDIVIRVFTSISSRCISYTTAAGQLAGGHQLSVLVL